MLRFSYQTQQTLIRTLGCSWRAGASMPVSGFTALFPDGWHDVTLEVCIHRTSSSICTEF